MRWLQLSIALLAASKTLTLSGLISCASADDARLQKRREDMINEQIIARGISDPTVLTAMRAVPRHDFVPPELRDLAYADRPLPIGWEQTISQPYIVALMTELAAVKAGERVLEIGTGSGYQAAVLAQITKDVYSIEIVPQLHQIALQRLSKLGLGADRIRLGDGYKGLPEHAPFDAILVTAAPSSVPEPLINQLKVGGRLVIPVGPEHGLQYLRVLTKNTDGTISSRDVLPVRFVPMTGQAQEK